MSDRKTQFQRQRAEEQGFDFLGDEYSIDVEEVWDEARSFNRDVFGRSGFEDLGTPAERISIQEVKNGRKKGLEATFTWPDGEENFGGVGSDISEALYLLYADLTTRRAPHDPHSPMNQPKLQPNFFRKKPKAPPTAAEVKAASLAKLRSSQVWKDKFRYYKISEGRSVKDAEALADESTEEYWARKRSSEGKDVAFRRNGDLNRDELDYLKRVVESLPVPFVSSRISTLGGAHRATLMFTISIDPRETWHNGILENSAYAHFSLGFEKDKWVLEQFTRSSKIAKIRKYSTPDLKKMERKLSDLPSVLGSPIKKNKTKMKKNSTAGLSLYANPYDNSAGFYFSTWEDFEKKYTAKYKKSGTEEYEIDFIDGDPIEQKLFQAMKVDHGNLGTYFMMIDELEALDDDQRVGMLWLMEDRMVDVDQAIQNAENVMVFEGEPSDYAESLIDDMGEVPSDLAEMYFDYDSFGRDLRISGDDIMGTEEEIENLQDGDKNDKKEAKKLQEWVESIEEMDDDDRAREFIDGIGGLTEAVNPEQIARYFDYEAWARDMGFNGEIDTFHLDGTDYVITNASEH